jgi:hypothetical protein
VGRHSVRWLRAGIRVRGYVGAPRGWAAQTARLLGVNTDFRCFSRTPTRNLPAHKTQLLLDIVYTLSCGPRTAAPRPERPRVRAAASPGDGQALLLWRAARVASSAGQYPLRYYTSQSRRALPSVEHLVSCHPHSSYLFNTDVFCTMQNTAVLSKLLSVRMTSTTKYGCI